MYHSAEDSAITVVVVVTVTVIVTALVTVFLRNACGETRAELTTRW